MVQSINLTQTKVVVKAEADFLHTVLYKEKLLQMGLNTIRVLP